MVSDTAANNSAADDNDLSLGGYFSRHNNLLFVLLNRIVSRKQFTKQGPNFRCQDYEPDDVKIIRFRIMSSFY
jgi:hypothetical protein